MNRRAFAYSVCVCLFAFTTQSETARSQSVAELTERLKQRHPSVRKEAAMELAKMGPAAEDAVPALVAALKETAPETQALRVEVSNALERIGEAAVPALIETLKDPNASVRRRAALILGQIGPPAKDAVPVLLVALKDKDRWLRAYAARALGGGFYIVEPWELYKGEMAFHFVMHSLDADVEGQLNPVTRAETRGGLGPEAKSAIPALIEALNDRDEYVRWHSAQAIGGFGLDAKAAIPALREMVRHPRPQICMHAASALVQLGEISLGLTTLIDMLNYEPQGFAPRSGLTDVRLTARLQAMEMLGDLGPAAKDAVSALAEALKNAENEIGEPTKELVRKTASEALRKIQAK